MLHAVWLAWSATWQSPTLNEPGHLASGLAHWSLGRFEPYAVNPPLVRMIAAIPVMAAGYEADWSGLRGRPGERPEFILGSQFIEANGPRSQRLFNLARWACIPFSLLGAWMCFIWGRALFGDLAGVLACGLWCVEPNIIAHGQLITPDVAATSLGLVAMWTFWRWLRNPGWLRGALMGAALGLAIIAKFSWLFLIGAWPALWLLAEWKRPASWKTGPAPRFLQLAASFVIALYVINSAYAFDGSFSRLDSFTFASHKLSGQPDPTQLGNRFTGTVLGSLPVPVPRQFLAGLDLQQRDFEHFPHASYLNGEWRQGGWWYYYLHAAAVKVPLGLWILAATAFIVWLCRRRSSPSIGQVPDRTLGVLTLLVPALALFAIVSSQTAFNHHFRYVLPCFGPAFIFCASPLATAGRWLTTFTAANWLWIATSSALAAPFSLAYFNELAGGMHNGSQHLLHSNIDWGQDLVALNEWIAAQRDNRPVFLAYYGFYDPAVWGVPTEPSPQGPFWGETPRDWSFRPGRYAVSVNYLHGTAWRLTNPRAYEPLLEETPVARCGGSIAIYHVNEALARRLTQAVIDSRR